MPLRLQTIDAHAAGAPLRLVVGGFPTPGGRTLHEKRGWLERRCEPLRRALVGEPRGHADMTAALLTEAAAPGAAAGVIFMHAGGLGGFCGHGIIAVTTIVLERGLVTLPAGADSLTFETLAGPVRVRATRGASEGQGARVTLVAYRAAPAWVAAAGVPVTVRGHAARVDVAWAAGYYAVADAELLGLPLGPEALPDLRRAGLQALRDIDTQRVVQPAPDGVAPSLDGIVFTTASDREGADLRGVTIYADGSVDRSPSGSGTTAALAVLDAMGLAPAGRPIVHESAWGTRFAARVAERVRDGERQAIVAEVEGSAWITGEHTFVLDESDPLRAGF